MRMLGQTANQLINVYKGLSTGKRVALVLMVALVLGGLSLMVHLANRPDYRLLFSNLSPQDAGTVIDKLKEQRLPYKVEGKGGRILIPSEKVGEIRLQLASEGVPQGEGLGFEIFDDTSPWSTGFVQKLNYQRALQGELARTISSLAEVEHARVHIVMPRDSLFIEEQNQATASVMLKMRPGRRLERSQITGIVHLVAGSVEGLTPENVTIVDTSGNMLSGPKNDALSGGMDSNQLEIKKKMELGLQQRLQTMLDKALGKNRSVVQVSMAVNFRKVERTEEIYDADNIVVRSEQRSSEKSKRPFSIRQEDAEASLPDGAEAGGASIVDSNFQKKNETVNYEVGRVVNHIVEPVRRIERLYVAVLIDGNYEDIPGEDEPKYIPRTEEEIKTYESLIKKASGFNAERGDQIEIANVRFESNGLGEESELMDFPPAAEKFKMLSVVAQKYLVKIALFLLFFLFMVRPLYRWFLFQERAVEISRLEEGAPGRQEEDTRINWQEKRKELPPSERVLEIVQADPDVAANVARKWLKEEE
jgi:flagellar M-ring protein FliF